MNDKICIRPDDMCNFFNPKEWRSVYDTSLNLYVIDIKNFSKNILLENKNILVLDENKFNYTLKNVTKYKHYDNFSFNQVINKTFVFGVFSDSYAYPKKEIVDVINKIISKHGIEDIGRRFEFSEVDSYKIERSCLLSVNKIYLYSSYDGTWHSYSIYRYYNKYAFLSNKGNKILDKFDFYDRERLQYTYNVILTEDLEFLKVKTNKVLIEESSKLVNTLAFYIDNYDLYNALVNRMFITNFGDILFEDLLTTLLKYNFDKDIKYKLTTVKVDDGHDLEFVVVRNTCMDNYNGLKKLLYFCVDGTIFNICVRSI